MGMGGSRVVRRRTGCSPAAARWRTSSCRAGSGARHVAFIRLMVTAEEIERIAVLRGAEPREPGAACAHVRRHQPRAGRVRRARGRRARAVRPARRPHRGGQARRRHRAASSASAHPGDLFGEVPITLGTVFPVGFRAAEPSRVMRVEPHDYHAIAALAPDVAARGRRLAGNRIERPRRPAGHRRGATAAARDRRRRSVGRRRAPTCGASSTATRSRFTWLQPDAPRRGRAVGRPAAGRGRLPGDPRRRRQDGRAAAAAPRGRAARPRHRAGGRGVRHGRSSAPARPGWRRPCTARRRACGRS